MQQRSVYLAGRLKQFRTVGAKIACSQRSRQPAPPVATEKTLADITNYKSTIVTEDILALFHARRGLISVVGAGGKKSTLFRLIAAHPGRIGITSTVYTPPFRRRLGAEVVIAGPEELPQAVAEATKDHLRVAYALFSDKPARFKGVPPQQVLAIHQSAGFEATFIKADGARLRWIKAPDQNEPQIPQPATTVVPVVSVRAIGQPLSGEVAHRWQRVARITGLAGGETITAIHIARLLASPQGALKNAGNGTVIPVINMVESRAQQSLATAAAEQALALTNRISHVVLAAMAKLQPVVAVIRR